MARTTLSPLSEYDICAIESATYQPNWKTAISVDEIRELCVLAKKAVKFHKN